MNHLKLKLSLKIASGEENILGPGIIRLLNLIEEEHSLRSAAKAMAMSYSKAWRILNHAETHWGFDLTDKKIGGEHGGESSLTPEARELIHRYEEFELKTKEAAEDLFDNYFSQYARDPEEDLK